MDAQADEVIVTTLDVSDEGEESYRVCIVAGCAEFVHTEPGGEGEAGLRGE